MKGSMKTIALVGLLLAMHATPALAEQKGNSGDLLSWFSRLYGVRVGASEAVPAQKHALKPAHQRSRAISSFSPVLLPSNISFSLGSEASGQAVRQPAQTAPPAEKNANRVAVDSTFRFGDYYAGLAVDYDLPRPVANVGAKNGRGSSLDLGAGAKVKGLHAGVGLSSRNGYQPDLDQKMASGLPHHIFSTARGENAYEQDGYALFFSLGYDLTEHLNMSGTLGYARVKNRTESDAALESQRWGVDIGASYRLLDNLYYDAHLGYVTLDGAPDAPPPASLSAGSDPAGGSNIYHVINQLRMTF